MATLQVRSNTVQVNKLPLQVNTAVETYLTFLSLRLGNFPFFICYHVYTSKSLICFIMAGHFSLLVCPFRFCASEKEKGSITIFSSTLTSTSIEVVALMTLLTCHAISPHIDRHYMDTRPSSTTFVPTRVTRHCWQVSGMTACVDCGTSASPS